MNFQCQHEVIKQMGENVKLCYEISTFLNKCRHNCQKKESLKNVKKSQYMFKKCLLPHQLLPQIEYSIMWALL